LLPRDSQILSHTATKARIHSSIKLRKTASTLREREVIPCNYRSFKTSANIVLWRYYNWIECRSCYVWEQ
jgi:hypothetical protein